MISLYIHLPFCDQKCKYCSFQVIPCDKIQEEEKIIDNYVGVLKQEIIGWGEFLRNDGLAKQEVTTLYFGGGTPNKIGTERMIELIDCVVENFDLEYLGELSIELNPYPEEETLALISTIQKKYKDFSRIRRSFGIQSFDSEILKDAGRQYSFPAMIDFLRKLRELKWATTIFNFDFIAFGRFNLSKKGNQILRDEHKQKTFQEFVASGFADSFSVYTLELFSGSDRYTTPNSNPALTKSPTQDNSISDDAIYDEFSWLKNTILDAGYQRYELSNFAIVGRGSIHNRIYRNMENYIGVGTSASSFVNFKRGKFASDGWKSKFAEKFGLSTVGQASGLRWTNTILLAEYEKGNYLDNKKTLVMTQEDYLIEQFFLRLRTDEGIEDISQFESVLEKNRPQQIENLQKNGFCIFDGQKLVLSDTGMDVYNTVVTDLLGKI